MATLIYNDVVLDAITSLEHEVQPVMDPTGLDRECLEVTLTAEGVWSDYGIGSGPGPAPGYAKFPFNGQNYGLQGDRLGVSLYNLRESLEAPRRPLFYLIGGVIAGLSQVAIDPGSTVPTIGASGAIAATLGAYFVMFPRARVTSLVFLGFFYQLIDVPAIIVLGFWFVLQLISGIASLGAVQSGGVAVFAHIGGFLIGAVIARVLLVIWPRTRGSAPTSAVG